MEPSEFVVLDRPTHPRGDVAEPDWRRLPGYRDVTQREWESAKWQRAHAVKDIRGLKDVFGGLLSDALAADLQRDQAERATMPLLVPPQMLSTMDERDLEHDPVRRYMLPRLADRRPDHPHSSRDSLHERDMWAVEGLTHRYPSKVLVELVTTCPQYCGHCTRMDLVGGSTSQVAKLRFGTRELERRSAMLDYLRANDRIHDVVVSGGDIASVPIGRLEEFVAAVVEIPHVRDVRLASKSLAALPQHFLESDVLEGLGRLAERAQRHGVSLALHTHANHARQVTPLVARAARALLDLGFRDVRNQGVLLRGVNATAEDALDLSLALLGAWVMPYYLYMCDMIPGAEHWRTALWEAQEIQEALMGRLPGYAVPRVVCDVPWLGKRWVHQAAAYDRDRGISTWTAAGSSDTYEFYDPVDTLPESGRRWWQETVQA